MDIENIKKHDEECEEKKKALKEKGIRGLWEHEPNRKNWTAHGLDCMIVRHPSMLQWCGYVGVKNAHPLFQKGYSELYDYEKEKGIDISVHGGLTYSNLCHGYICHVDEKDASPTFWFGYDCAHWGDLVPSMIEHKPIGLTFFTGHHGEVYRDEKYVTKETERLAKQLSKVKKQEKTKKVKKCKPTSRRSLKK